MQKNKIGIGLVFVVAVAVNGWLAWPAIRDLAPTYDEPLHVAAGYVFLETGNALINGMHHPPFSEMWSAWPLTQMHVKPLLPLGHPAWRAQTWGPQDQYRFADVFLYKNRVPMREMMVPARTMQWILHVVLGFLILLTAFRLAGSGGAVFALTAWTFSPVLLAHGTLVTTDLAFATFYFAFFAAFLLDRWWVRGAAAGVALGLCFASKYFAIALLPSLAACLIWERWRRGSIDWRALGLMVPVALVVIGLVYRFQGLNLFWMGLTNMLHRANAGRSSYFWGQHGSDGWLLYFPVAIVLKTPLGQLAATLMGGFLLWKQKRLPSYLWLPPLLFLLVACLSRVQIGHRYVLVCYPFFILAVAGVALGGRAWKWIGAGFLVWQAAVASMARPHYLAYFNELIGGSRNGYHYFTDSNVDWGQALSLLPEVLTPAERHAGIYLCYFGVADPNEYGLRYLQIGGDGLVDHPDGATDNLTPTTLVISATHLQATYYADRTLFSWLHDLTPRAVVGHSLFIYDLSGHPERLAWLRQLRS